MSGYDIRRYCPEISTNDAWIAQRSHESYAKNYAMIFTHDEPLAGRNAKKVIPSLHFLAIDCQINVPKLNHINIIRGFVWTF